MKPVLMSCLAIHAALLGISAQAQTRYTVSADGREVSDSLTNLIWRRCVEGMTASVSTCSGNYSSFTHEEALLRAREQANSDGKAWRLPNVKELSSVVDKGRGNPAIDTATFPATLSAWYWSSTPRVGVSSSSTAMVVDFSYGNVNSRDRDYHYYVRLVRSGQ